MLINDRYLLGRKLGQGSGGVVYLAVHVVSGAQYAVKLESIHARRYLLEYEARLYRYLHGGEGFNKVYWYGCVEEHNVMVMDLQGSNLKEVLAHSGGKFTLKTVLMLADQMITRMAYFHSKLFLHRNVKPNNFLVGLDHTENKNVLFLIDSGTSRKYINPGTKQHIPYRDDCSISGNIGYISINRHLGIDRSRRDDLESMAYMMICFLKGYLPWTEMHNSDYRKLYDQVLKSKLETDALCHGCTAEFKTYLEYCRGLKFEETPDYDYLKGIFKDLFIKEGYVRDDMYDWHIKQAEKKP